MKGSQQTGTQQHTSRTNKMVGIHILNTINLYIPLDTTISSNEEERLSISKKTTDNVGDISLGGGLTHKWYCSEPVIGLNKTKELFTFLTQEKQLEIYCFITKRINGKKKSEFIPVKDHQQLHKLIQSELQNNTTSALLPESF